MVFLSSRAGVPVCRRPREKPAEARDAESPVEGASPMRPAGKRLSPEKSSARPEKRYLRRTYMYFTRQKCSSAYNDLRAIYNFARVCADQLLFKKRRELGLPSLTPITFPHRLLSSSASLEWSKTRSKTLPALMSS